MLGGIGSFCPSAQLLTPPFITHNVSISTAGNNHLYMAGGEFPDGSASRSMWRYDPCFDSWQEMASMNAPRSELGMSDSL